MQVQFAYFLLCPGLGFRPSGALIFWGGEERRGEAAAAAGKRWRELIRGQGSEKRISDE